jgi:hypothetical protein
VRAGLPITHLTGEAVARFIQQHGLYGAKESPAAPTGGSPGTHGAGHI